MAEAGDRRGLARYPAELTVVVERLAARYSAWYELFPRSEPPAGKASAGFADVIRRLPYVRDLGFDVLYFPPIHPIGRTNRKGRNNSLTAGPNDPGSPYAIGAAEGGHTAIEPGLGSLEDFRQLVAAALAEGLEIALDFAIQCSPDHPWLKEHPDWFDWRADGSMRYAENPPKKYEDIVNVDFEKGYPGLWLALRDVVLFWIGEGVRIFRVDNPHTKPVVFWEWLIGEIHDRHPEVVFLAEAFTRPRMMEKLAKVGFSQSYTYFTWRSSKEELTEYFTELCQGPSSDYLRPNLFTNTPDINPPLLQTGGRPAFMQRAALAATLGSAYGIYSGFELCEFRGPAGARGISQFGEIRDPASRLERAGQYTRLYRAAEPDPPRESGAPRFPQSHLLQRLRRPDPALRQDDPEPRQCPARRGQSRSPWPPWLRLRAAAVGIQAARRRGPAGGGSLHRRQLAVARQDFSISFSIRPPTPPPFGASAGSPHEP